MGEVKDKLVKISNGDTVVDLGDLLDPANPYVTDSNCTATLVDDASCAIDVKVTVPELSPTPDLTNKVSVLYHPEGFPNDIADTDSVDIDTLHPSFTVTKACKSEPISQAGPAVFTITFNNTGDADLHVVPSEGAAFNVAAGRLLQLRLLGQRAVHRFRTQHRHGGRHPREQVRAGQQLLVHRQRHLRRLRQGERGKTVSGQPPAADQEPFTFELRQGLDGG